MYFYIEISIDSIPITLKYMYIEISQCPMCLENQLAQVGLT